MASEHEVDVEMAMAAAESGSAGHWPTVAAVLRDEVLRLRRQQQVYTGHPALERWSTHGHWMGLFQPTEEEEASRPASVAKCGGVHMCTQCRNERLAASRLASADTT